MPISINPEKQIFKLDGAGFSYAFFVDQFGYLEHLHYGARLDDGDLTYLASTFPLCSDRPRMANTDSHFSKDVALMEYPAYGCGDHRSTALAVRRGGGTNDTDLTYKSYRIFKGKPMPDGLPATFGTEEETTTLEVVLADIVSGVEAHLFYTVFEGTNAMTRRVEIVNPTETPLYLEHVASGCFDFADCRHSDVIHFYGDWAKEFTPERLPVGVGALSFGSRTGSSSQLHNPFIVLCDRDANEDDGEAYGFNFVYSGNFENRVEMDCNGGTRLTVGIQPEGFEWKLGAGETFTAPEVVSVFSENGFGEMSRTFHRLYREHLTRGYWKDKQRPILINNWEATYFNFDEEKLYGIAKAASELGIEMFVLDDGWFGHRDSDNSSLGDWFVNENKIKGGLKALVEKINGLGMKFGLWFEPEMICMDSELYQAHPDWILGVDDRTLSVARHQYILDFSRDEVVDCIYDQMTKILDNVNIDYVKWDFNRNLTEVANSLMDADRQKEVGHRYVLGLYRLLDRITSRYPKLLLEGCSSGGGRFDPAWLYYAPQVWTSDDSDGLERMKIQYGTSFVYPLSSMGAHVSVCPNHQTHRTVPLETRANVATFGTFGYEMDVGKMTEEEKEAVKRYNARFYRYNPIVRDGDFYRLITPFDQKVCAWECVSQDKNEALVYFARLRVDFSSRLPLLKLRGLDPDKRYRDEASGLTLTGRTWMNAGINVTKRLCDNDSVIYHLVAVQD